MGKCSLKHSIRQQQKQKNPKTKEKIERDLEIMQSMKETALNIAASAKSGLDKTRATLEEKVEKMQTSDPVEKQMATQIKEEKINQAELQKRETREHNAAMKEAAQAGTHSTTGHIGHSTLTDHGTEQPTSYVVVESTTRPKQNIR